MNELNRIEISSSKKAFWQQHIEACMSNSLSQKEYCRSHGLALSTFGYWKRKLAPIKNKSPRFYPLTVQSRSSTPDNSAAESGLSLLLQNGRNSYRIKVAENFSSNCLRKLLSTLEEL